MIEDARWKMSAVFLSITLLTRCLLFDVEQLDQLELVSILASLTSCESDLAVFVDKVLRRYEFAGRSSQRLSVTRENLFRSKALRKTQILPEM